ncbi:MAG: inorganic diphosphatase [Rubrobacteraceae bacterium]
MLVNLEELPVGESAPLLVNAVVEVPVGSRNKYEYDPDLGIIVRDRVLPGVVRYPADYGFVPSTIAEDGDPIDIMVAAYDPAFPGCMVQARPVGALDMSDSSGRGRTILAVPEDDPRFADIKSLDNLPDQNLTEIEEFFEVYKRLEGDKEVEIHGWLSLEEAHEVIRDSAK